MLEDGAGFVGIGERLRSDFWISWFSLTWSNVGLTDYVKDIKQKLQDMYVCVPHARKDTTHRDRNLLGK